jgi:hypothetical protein
LQPGTLFFFCFELVSETIAPDPDFVQARFQKMIFLWAKHLARFRLPDRLNLIHG